MQIKCLKGIHSVKAALDWQLISEARSHGGEYLPSPGRNPPSSARQSETLSNCLHSLRACSLVCSGQMQNALLSAFWQA